MHKNLDLSLNLLKSNHLSSTSSSHSKSNKLHLLNSIIKSNKSTTTQPQQPQPQSQSNQTSSEDLNNFIWDYIHPPNSTSTSNQTRTTKYEDYEERLKEVVKIYALPNSNQQEQQEHPFTSTSTSSLHPHLNIRPRSFSTPPEQIIHHHHHHQISSKDDHSNSIQPQPSLVHSNLNHSSNPSQTLFNPSSPRKPALDPHQSLNQIPSKVICTTNSSTSSSSSSSSSSNTTLFTSTEFKVLPRIGPKPNQINLSKESEEETKESEEESEAEEAEGEGEEAEQEEAESEEVGQEAKREVYKKVILERLPIRTSSIHHQQTSFTQPRSGRVKIEMEDYVIFNKSHLII
ncbi:hypothetical protein DFH28DRAFT_1157518 [Melampsora americana]|nr:hypothetical protein DFH28DRAFT_1157518 [Melampsora americana]